MGAEPGAAILDAIKACLCGGNFRSSIGYAQILALQWSPIRVSCTVLDGLSSLGCPKNKTLFALPLDRARQGPRVGKKQFVADSDLLDWFKLAAHARASLMDLMKLTVAMIIARTVPPNTYR